MAESDDFKTQQVSHRNSASTCCDVPLARHCWYIHRTPTSPLSILNGLCKVDELSSFQQTSEFESPKFVRSSTRQVRLEVRSESQKMSQLSHGLNMKRGKGNWTTLFNYQTLYPTSSHRRL